jgi:23S rRNA (cytidine1920-2'-O)/16S rRNA (cytidine1409-2'-O)-methyltransferase
MNPDQPKKKKCRADQILVNLGLAATLEEAQSLIMAGRVYSGEKRVNKAGTPLSPDTPLRVAEKTPEYVSRGGEKLAHALKYFMVDPTGWIALDAGASTGGFTDCLLHAGVKKVYAVDVGYGQFDPRLRADPRVVPMERFNVRRLLPEDLDEEMDLVVADLSFISLTMVIPALEKVVKSGGRLLVLIKPQFEVKKEEVGPGGVVREPEKHQAVIEKITVFSRNLGLKPLGVTESPLKGPKGNREFFLALEKTSAPD